MNQEERNALAEAVFKDELTFEKRVLDIHNENDRREVMQLLAEEIVAVTFKEHLHFVYLKSYDDLHTEEIVKAILQRITNETAGFLEEKLQYTKTMTLQTIRQTPHLLFLKRMSLYYFKRYGYLVYERIADSFFERIAMLPSVDKAPKVLMDAVTGTPKRPAILKGNAVSLEHVWNHVRKAATERKKEMGKVQISLSSILNIMNEEELEPDKRAKLKERYEANRKQLEAVRHKALSEFDGSVRRLKQLVVQVLESL